ncbi:polyprotein [Operophtera brumata]|uniref:Polyprotein n=1 Tax=Operophtera brumata TaxID=104452 RepID=A0A0L7KNT8_OPEBR|nr:polyprotein [Operophtera brumata]
MPVTRSQAGTSRRPPMEEPVVPQPTPTEASRPTPARPEVPVRPAVGQGLMSEDSDFRISGVASSSDTKGTMTTATGTTDNTMEAQPSERRTRTVGKSKARPASKSASLAEKARKRREVELRAELNRQVLRQAQAAADLARTDMELLRLDEEDAADLDSAVDEPEGRSEGVRDWVEATVDRMSGGGHLGEEGTSEEGRPGDVLAKECAIKLQDPTATAGVKPEDTTPKGMEASGTDALAEAIARAITSVPRSGTVHQPAYMHELPVFDGSCGEWLAFRTVYEDTAPLFSSVQNMARLRKAIRGPAKEAVRSILYSECAPSEVLESLRRRYGRPDALVLAELEKVKNLPRTTENARDVCVFASVINNTVATINGLKKPHYLKSPEMIKVIIDKLPMVLKYRWYDFAAEHEDPDLSLISQFLNREAERCGPYASQEATAKKVIHPQRQSAHAAKERETQLHTCPHCEGSHSLEECKKFRQASVTDRWVIVKKASLCFKCLRTRHWKESCRRPPCKQCRRWHHHLLHEEGKQPDYGPKDQSSSDDSKEGAKEVANNVHLSQVNATKGARAYLKRCL